MSDPVVPRSSRLAAMVTTAELLAAGNSEDQIKTLCRRGNLIRVARGVYADGQSCRGWLMRSDGERVLSAAAALAVAAPGTVVSHQSAAQLHGVALIGRPPRQVSLTCSPATPRRTGVTRLRLHAAGLPGEHVTTLARMPVTTVARTVVDLARTLEFRAGVATADSALYQRLTSKDELRSVAASCQRWRGIRRAIAVIEFADGQAESPLESLARVAFDVFGLPAPELQAWLGEPGDQFRTDFYWRRYRTVAEVDGAFKYQDPQRALAQLQRDSCLRKHGLEVVHFDWDDIIRKPDRVAAAIREAFRRGTLLAPPQQTAG